MPGMLSERPDPLAARRCFFPFVFFVSFVDILVTCLSFSPYS
jgi:hypothetical protein